MLPSLLFTTIFIFSVMFQPSTSDIYEEYCKISEKSIVCLRKDANCSPDSETCGEIKNSQMSPDDRNEALTIHNELRQRRATGKDARQDDIAANMNALSYNLQLEFAAQCFANSCGQNKDPSPECPGFTTVGQNFYYGEAKAMKKVIEDWYDEIEMYKSGSIFELVPEAQHYTQLIWAKTSQLGCGKTLFKENMVFVCFYSPAGNVGDEIFIDGKPASKCPKGMKKNKSYKGLCGVAQINAEGSGGEKIISTLSRGTLLLAIFGIYLLFI